MILEARSGDSEWNGGPGISMPSDLAGHAHSASWLQRTRAGLHALTPLVMFYNLARKMLAYVCLAQIREFADVTGQLDDNFQ